MAAKKAATPGGPYCYALLDAGEVFYIGKGRGRRMFAHEREARAGKSGDKCDRIRAAWAAGREIDRRILGVYESDGEALSAERAFIAAHEGLTNCTAGGEGYLLDAKERIRRRAQSMLDRLLPFEAWAVSLSMERRQLVRRVCGSLEALYELVRSGLVRDAAEPEPNVFLIAPDGSVTCRWED